MMKIEICGTSARCIQPMLLTAGLVGAQVEFTFDAAWDGLSRIAVFTDGLVTKDAVLGADNRCEIPHEVLTEAGRVLCVGVYGAAGDGTVVIPTVSAACGMVRIGAEPTGDEGYPPTPDVAAQLLQRIEAVESSGGGGGTGGSGAVQSVNGKTGRVELTAEDVGAMAANAAVVKTINGTVPDASGNVTLETDGAGGALELLFEVTTTEDVLRIDTGIDLNQYNEIFAYCVTISSDSAKTTHLDWGVADAANREVRVTNGLHNTQVRCFPLHLIRTSGKAMLAEATYGYWDGNVMTANSSRTYHVCDNLNITSNFYCTAYAYGDTMLKAGTILKVYGR